MKIAVKKAASELEAAKSPQKKSELESLICL